MMLCNILFIISFKNFGKLVNLNGLSKMGANVSKRSKAFLYFLHYACAAWRLNSSTRVVIALLIVISVVY